MKNIDIIYRFIYYHNDDEVVEKAILDLIDYLEPMKVNGVPYVECPRCEEGLYCKNNYCPHCGQALDWAMLV